MNTEIVKVEFYDSEIITFQEEGNLFISVQQACESIGLDAPA